MQWKFITIAQKKNRTLSLENQFDLVSYGNI